jgi:O-methyltransferase
MTMHALPDPLGRVPPGYELVPGPLTYNADGLATQHNADFRNEPRFARAYAAGMATIRSRRPALDVAWRVKTCCWAADHAAHLEGDFVECGVFTGIYSRAIVEYLDFGRRPDRRFWLLDTFEGIPTEVLTEPERRRGIDRMNAKYGADCSAEVRATFAPFPNVHVIKGIVPYTLPQVEAEKIAYLSIDMNAAAPEIAALEHFWDMLVPGAMVVLDDYGFRAHIVQKIALDEFARSHGVSILPLPTGQGLIVKP